MLSTRLTLGIAVVLAITTVVPRPALAWQFREVAVDGEPTEASEQSILVPSSEPFVDPAPQAADAQSDETAETESGRRPKGTPDASAPETSGRTDEKTRTDAQTAKPEPIPDPETNIEPDPMQPEDVDPAPLELNPLEAFTITSSNPNASPAAAAAQAPHPRADIRVASFNNAQPGVTTAEELEQAWGEPAKELPNEFEESGKVLVFKVPSFQQIDVVIKDDVVASILVHLAQPLPVAHVAQGLDLAAYRPVPVPDEYGEVLGQAYPERGLLFSFADTDAGRADGLRVAAILLEPLSAETFRLRAQHDFTNQYELDLADLDEAIYLNPDDADAYWLKAEVLDAVGLPEDAVACANSAVRLEPTSPLYRLTRARLLAKTGDRQAALGETQTLLDEIDLPHELAARANCQLGDLLAVGPEADHQAAIKYHLKAVDLAIKVVGDRRFAVRRMAKRVLIDAHLSVARDIAMGNFQRQREVVPKWLLRATELADEFIARDRGDALTRLHIYRTTLAAYAELKGSFDASLASEEALEDARQLITQASDPLYKQQIERVLGETLLHSAKIERTRGRFETAMRYANNAIALIENANDHDQLTDHDRYLKGQLYFLVGSLYAVHKQDHQEAVTWYGKASPLLGAQAISPLVNPREQGEIQVSMGLSFWETGEHQKAVSLTQQGAELMKQAVQQGTLQMGALAVPYGNLATMHSKLGNQEHSRKFAELASKLEQPGDEATRR